MSLPGFINESVLKTEMQNYSYLKNETTKTLSNKTIPQLLRNPSIPIDLSELWCWSGECRLYAKDWGLRKRCCQTNDYRGNPTIHCWVEGCHYRGI
jgi:hypothetical protein